MSAYLTIDAVSVAYGAAAPPVLDRVSLQVQRGEMVALLGSSGCGMTTLLRAIAGFVKPRSGRIVVDGRGITEPAPEARQAAMVFQSYALWPHMDVAANIGYGLRMRGVARAKVAERVEQLLRLLQLEGFGPTALRDRLAHHVEDLAEGVAADKQPSPKAAAEEEESAL